MEFKNEALHTLDIITDSNLARVMYELSRKERPGKNPFTFGNHYAICFVSIVLCTLAPYIIQYAVYISMLYKKDLYNHKFLKSRNKFTRLFLYAMLTFIGPLMICLMDVFAKVEAGINLIMILFMCKKDQKPLNLRIRKWMKMIEEDIFLINEH
jgi:hypothetical protein